MNLRARIWRAWSRLRPAPVRDWGVLLGCSAALPIVAHLLGRSGWMPDVKASTTYGVQVYAVAWSVITMMVASVWVWNTLVMTWRLARGAQRVPKDTSRLVRVAASSVFFASWLPALYVFSSVYARTSMVLMSDVGFYAYGVAAFIVISMFAAYGLYSIRPKLEPEDYSVNDEGEKNDE